MPCRIVPVFVTELVAHPKEEIGHKLVPCEVATSWESDIKGGFLPVTMAPSVTSGVSLALK